tara:strand:+ start:7803 stop:8030 length:228 start_codon:yes stop_codon:yes gene_type:complete
VKKQLRKLRYQTIPLSGAFMLTSMLGFLVVTIYTIYERISLTWGFAFDLIFVIMFIASVASITPVFPSELDKKRS